jgi:hypothetical protein
MAMGFNFWDVVNPTLAVLPQVDEEKDSKRGQNCIL